MNIFNCCLFYSHSKHTVLWTFPKKIFFAPIYIASVIIAYVGKCDTFEVFRLKLFLRLAAEGFVVALIFLTVSCLFNLLLILRVKEGELIIYWGISEKWKCDLSNLNIDLKIKKTLKHTVLSFKNIDNERILIVLNPYLVKLIRRNIEKQPSKDSYSRVLSII